MGAGNEILTAIAQLRAEVAEVKALLLRAPSSAPAASAPTVAPDSDLDGQWGDPEVKKDPPRWTKQGGQPFAPCRMSEGSAEWLDAVADFLQFKADNPREGKEKYADYDRRDSSRARGWAARKRAGWKPVATGRAWDEPPPDEL